MATFAIISRPGCNYCDRAKQLFEDNGLDYVEIGLTEALMPFFKALELRTVPQIWLGTTYIGGHDDLVEYLAFSAQNTLEVHHG